MAIIQEIEQFANRNPQLYEALAGLLRAQDAQVLRIRRGSAKLSGGRAIVSLAIDADAVVTAWYAVEDPTTVAGQALTCPPSKRIRGKQFTILSSSNTDTSAVEWLVVSP